MGMAISTTTGISEQEQGTSELTDIVALTKASAVDDDYVKVHVPFFKTAVLTTAVLISIVVGLVVTVFIVSGLVDIVRSIATALR